MKYLLSISLSALLSLAATVTLSNVPPSLPASGREGQRATVALGDLQRSVVRLEGPRARGTGVVTRGRDGHWWAWTAAHVVLHNRHGEEFPTFVARLPNGSNVPATVAHVSEGWDIAVLDLGETDLPLRPMAFYRGAAQVGETVYHVGSPLGVMDGTVTAGIVSFVGRAVRDNPEFFRSMPLSPDAIFDQVCSPTWPGSSGGAVCRADGRCIGLVSCGVGECMTMIVPSWRLYEFAAREHCQGAICDGR